MKTAATLLNAGSILLALSVACAQDVSGTATTAEPAGALGSIEVAGFGDLYRALGATEGRFGVGQMELRLAKLLDGGATLEAAIAFSGDSFSLGSFQVDFPLFAGRGDRGPASNRIERSGFVVGQFDVPFGIDWHVYSSIDRRLVSVPLMVENTHGCWNDYGIQGYLETQRLNLVLYGANGFDYQRIDPSDAPVDVPMEWALGGRLGVKPVTWMEFGGSCAGFLDANQALDMALAGVDLRVHCHGLAAKGEFVAHRTGMGRPDQATHTGFYGQGQYDFGRWFTIARYGKFSPEGGEAEELSRLSLGAGWVISEECESRVEYQVSEESDNEVALLQFVVGF